MIKINAIILIVVFGFMLVRPAVPFIDYVVRKDFIIENLCINRSKKEMKCNGKCHLKEEIRKEASRAPENNVPLPTQEDRVEGFDYLLGQMLRNRPQQFLVIVKTYYLMDYTFQFIPSIFHPPMQGLSPQL
jgi:hypothetical protein